VVAINQDVSHHGPGLEPNVQEDERSLPFHVGVHHLAAPPALQQAQDPALRVQGRVKKFCYAAASLIYRLRATMHAHFKAHCFFTNRSLFFKGNVLLLFLYHYERTTAAAAGLLLFPFAALLGAAACGRFSGLGLNHGLLLFHEGQQVLVRHGGNFQRCQQGSSDLEETRM
jgi:hypothetical protein